jgi:hypothetical protein
MCILQPFEDLRRGSSPIHRSIASRYSSLPPQLIFLRATRAGHFLLAALSITAILANVLTVSLSRLFSIDDATRNRTLLLKQTLKPDFQPARVDLWATERSYSQSDPHYVAMANITSNTSLPPWMTPNYYFLPVEITIVGMSNKTETRYSIDTFGFGVNPDCGELLLSGSNNTYEFRISQDATRATFFMNHTIPDGSTIQCISNNTLADPTVIDPQIMLSGLIYGRQALELVSSMRSKDNGTDQEAKFCENLFVAGWVRANIEWSNKTFETPYGKFMNTTSLSTNMTFIACQPKLATGLFNVEVDSSGYVLHASQKRLLEPGIGGDLNSVVTLTSYSMGMGNQKGPIWHNDTFAIDWTNYLMKSLMKSTAILDPSLPVPNFASTSKALGDVYNRIFTIHLNLKSDGFAPSADGTSVSGIASWKEKKVFMSETMFKISITILAWDIIIVFQLYIWAPPAFLPRLPINIASILSYVAASHAMNEVRDDEGGSVGKKEGGGTNRDQRFGFGKFIGTDGRTHVGIERVPFVTTLERRRTGSGMFGLRKRGANTGDIEGTQSEW